jgi:hypothetical protein
VISHEDSQALLFIIAGWFMGWSVRGIWDGAWEQYRLLQRQRSETERARRGLADWQAELIHKARDWRPDHER